MGFCIAWKEIASKPSAMIGGPHKGWTAPWSPEAIVLVFDTASKYMASANFFWFALKDIFKDHKGFFCRSIFSAYNLHVGMGPCDCPHIVSSIGDVQTLEDGTGAGIHPSFGQIFVRGNPEIPLALGLALAIAIKNDDIGTIKGLPCENSIGNTCIFWQFGQHFVTCPSITINYEFE